MERLKKLQRDYLLRITEGRFDEAYFADRVRIGQTHERVELLPRWYLLAYRKYCEIISPLIRDHYGDDQERAHESIRALEKAFMLDASLAMDAYITSDRYRHAQQLESIVHDSADIIFMLDTDKRIRTWNRAAERVFGWRADEILGKSVTTIVPTDPTLSGELERIDREIQAHGHYHFETVRVAKDGRRVPVEVTVSLMRDPQGNPVGRSAILRDITDRKRLQEAKLQAERLAVIGAMSARLAHEIRNPLSSITLNIELVRDEIEALTRERPESAKESRELLRAIESELRRIQRVMEDYLKFGRLPKLQHETVALNELLADELAFMQSLFDAADVVVRTEFDPEVPLIRGDKEHLWQAVLNLVRNALEAMPNGGELSFRTAHETGGASLCISDTGKGIGARERERIFEPFFSTKPMGTGLGLPLTQQIIGEHGGSIECESVESKGTTFTIHLPKEGKH